MHVLLAGKLTALDAPGGGEVQMFKLRDALPSVGVQASMWRPWEDDLAGADCLHLFGSLPEHLPVVAAARRRGVPVVLSPIAWFDGTNCWREPGPLWRRAAAAGRHLLRAACPAIPSWRRRLYHAVDLLLPNSQAEAEQLVRLFGVARERICVVPNGCDERFAQADPAPFLARFGLEGFALYAGRIEPRKNQRTYLRALHGSGVTTVVLGDAVPEHAAYAAACRRAADGHVHFLGRLDHDDPLLASAYAACGCLVLASWFETPGLVALEAGMLGKPLVLPRGGSAEEYFGARATYVRPDRPKEIRAAVRAALRRPPDEELASLVRQRYSWRAAAVASRSAYERVGKEGGMMPPP